MPYRLTRKAKAARESERQRRAQATRDRNRMAREPQGRPPDLPELRRVVTVTDYDGPTAVTHTLHLYRTTRVDTYRVEADGKPWQLCGWSAVLAGLRKAYPRIPSPRSDFWW